MQFQKVKNVPDITSDNKDLSRYVTKKCVEVYDQSQETCNVNKEIRIKTSMLRSDLCGFSDAYIVAKGNITVTKKHLRLMILKHLIIQQLMQLLLIMQMIMHLVKRNWLLKIMHHLSIVFQKLMV